MMTRAVPAQRAVLPMLVLFAGCQEDGSRNSGILVDTLAGGGVAVSNPAIGLWSSNEGWRAEELFRIGSLGGDGPAVLGEIRALEVGPDGTVYLFDGMAGELRWFDGRGEPRGVMGRMGDGPGEFRNVVGMALSPDGVLWIADAGNARYTLVDEAGGFLEFPRASRASSLPTFGGWAGGFDLEGRFFERARDPAGGEGGDGLTWQMTHTAADGAVVGTATIPRVPVSVPTLGSGISVLLPYGPRSLMAWDPRGAVWQAASSSYSVARIALGGDTLQVVRRAWDPRPLGEMHRDSIRQVVEAVEGIGGQVPDDAVPSHVSPLRWIAQDDEYHLWICAGGTELCQEVDVFDPEGRYLGAVALPVPVLDQPVPVIRSGHLHAAVEGARGEPQLLVARIR
jgi:hypothetical protein